MAEADPAVLYRAAYASLERGLLADADRQAALGAAKRSGGPEEPSERAFHVLRAEILERQRRHEDALALLTASEAEPDEPEVQTRALATEGLVRCRRGRGGDARLADERLREARRHADRLDMPALAVDVAASRAACDIERGQLVDAERGLRRMLAIARRSGLVSREATAAGMLGLIRLRSGAYDAAAEWFRRSRDLAVKLDNDLLEVKGNGNLAQCFTLMGQPERALPLFEENIALARRHEGYETDILVDLVNSGDAYQLLHDSDRAHEFYERAAELAQRLDDREQASHIANGLALLALSAGDHDDAVRHAQAGLALRAQHEDAAGGLLSRLLLAQAWAGQGDRERAAHAYLRVATAPQAERRFAFEARARLAALYADMRRNSEAEAEFRRAFAAMDEGREALSEPSSRIAFVAMLREFYDSYVEFLVARGRERQALEVADRSRARLLMERLGERGRRLRAVTAAEFQRLAQRTDTTVLSYWLAPKQSYLWSVTSDSVELHALPGQDELCRMVGAYQSLVQTSRDPLAEQRPEGRALYETLIAPAARHVPRGSRALLVLDGCLHQLNFETLLAPGAPPRYWIEDVTLAVAPSLSVLDLRADAADVPREHSLLAIGAPQAANRDFPPLAQAEREVDSIAALFPSGRVETRIGAEARPDAYAGAQPERFALIHFAAHATANRDSPLDSAVILSPQGDDYKLYARDIMKVPLHADLVTLSACHSAGARAYAGEGLVGLSWAFLSAGSRDVIAGLWNVEDASTADLMAKLYRGLRDGSDPADALRAAKLELLGSHTAYRKPFYWAPFMVYTRAPAAAGGAGRLSAGGLRHKDR